MGNERFGRACTLQAARDLATSALLPQRIGEHWARILYATETPTEIVFGSNAMTDSFRFDVWIHVSAAHGK